MEYNIAASALNSLGIDLKVNLPTDGEWWGSEKPKHSGNYTGLLGDLQNARVDIGWGNLFVTDSRTWFMGFTDRYAISELCIMVPGPAPYPRILALTLPFDKTTWLSAVFTMAMGFLLLALYSWLYPSPETKGSQIFPLVVCLSIPQSSTIMNHLRGNGLRVGVMSFLLGMFIVDLGYSGSLISVLTVAIYQAPMNTIHELAESVKMVSGRKLFFTYFMHTCSVIPTSSLTIITLFSLSNEYEYFD